MTTLASRIAREQANKYDMELKQILKGLEFLANWTDTKKIDFPIAKSIKANMVKVKKIMPFAEEQIDKRYEACVRQSFSKARSDAMDNADYTKVGTKTRKVKR